MVPETQPKATADFENADFERVDVDIDEFLETAGCFHFHEYYLHVVVDEQEREMRLYLSVGENGDKQVVTAIGPIKAMISTDERERPDHWYLTAGEAATFLTWVRSYAAAENVRSAEFAFYEDSGRKLYDGTELDEEMIVLEYVTERRRRETVEIASTYKHPVQRLSRH